MIRIDINAGNAAPRIADAIAKLQDGRPLFQRIAAALEAETEANFAAQGRPGWAPLSQATIAARTKRAGGAARVYAAIHQFGGTIDRAPHSTKVRLRTDAKGDLVRQGTEGRSKSLAVFAKDSHKRARESWHAVDAYQITISARPYLPFTGTSAGATLQPEAAQSVLDVMTRMLGDTLT
ncbi:phage virion morphogenesis protein [Azoarcus sp. DN11]|uniref:phage virion morphogenesis protein n=1 Tax=Azoarcus sp. DN11 TaxID=356837 RepID=UPI000EB07324|nr:phage virion morphogenesis protein [Azoarcus sp. DN11]AYH45672.1 hypothetical protein CDA09_20190 [Azoarcus sp. DN11]